MDTIGAVLAELDKAIRELYLIWKQKGWKNKGLAETQVHLIQARAMLAERRGTEHVYEGQDRG
ncbi:MAG: hypothetical protein HFI66_04725 [Lachnospiraceae bacterium]|nr:hypothetical protein [Lachnospiraceae bacterium]